MSEAVRSCAPSSSWSPALGLAAGAGGEKAPAAASQSVSPSPRPDWSRADPSLVTLLLVDPTLELPSDVRVLIGTQINWKPRGILRPLFRVVSLVVVAGITATKRILPFEFSAHRAIDVLCIWFMRRFVSAGACALLMRHFVVETNLLAFLARNAPTAPGARIDEPDLRPLVCEDLGNNAVICHDLAVYNVLYDLGVTPGVDVRHARPLNSFDVSMLQVPPIEGDGDRPDPKRRWLNLDIETALYLMNIPFCLFTTTQEYIRGVNSFQLDESVCTAIANLTGDQVFRTWTPLKFSAYVTTWRDVPRDLFWHAAVNEFAHTRLRRIVDEAGAADA